MFDALWMSAFALPLLFTVIWAALWKGTRSARLWFAAGAPVVCILTFLVGMAFFPRSTCTPQAVGCSLEERINDSSDLILLGVACGFGFLWGTALGLLTLMIELWKMRRTDQRP